MSCRGTIVIIRHAYYGRASGPTKNGAPPGQALYSVADSFCPEEFTILTLPRAPSSATAAPKHPAHRAFPGRTEVIAGTGPQSLTLWQPSCSPCLTRRQFLFPALQSHHLTFTRRNGQPGIVTNLLQSEELQRVSWLPSAETDWHRMGISLLIPASSHGRAVGGSDSPNSAFVARIPVAAFQTPL